MEQPHHSGGGEVHVLGQGAARGAPPALGAPGIVLAGELMQFLTFDDEDGVFEVVLFPDVYRKSRFLLDGPGPYLVEGRVESQHGAIAVRAFRLEAVK